MVTVVVVRNAFAPDEDRERHEIELVENTSLQNLIDEYSDENANYKATINSESVEKETPIQDGDFIVIYPEIEGGGGGGKNVLGVVAAIALSVVAMGVGGLVAQGAWGAAIVGANATLGYLAAAAVMFLGSTLIGRFMGNGVSVDTGSYDSKNEATYNWNGVQTMSGQNNAVAVTYGKVKSGGQSIGKYIYSVDNSDYLNWLVAAGEGELTISDIKLNDNTVSYYSNLTCEIRSGTNDQTIISNFNDTYFTKTLSYILSDGLTRTDTAQGNATQGLIIKVEFPNGLYYAKDDGSLGTAWVQLHADYRIKGGSWINIIGSNARITSNYRNAVLNSSTAINGNYTISISSSFFSDDYFNSTKISVTDPSGNKSSTSISSSDTTVTCGVFTWNTSDLTSNRSFGGVSGTIVVAGNNATVSAATSSTIRREYRVDNIPAGEYEVQIYVVARSHSSDSSRAAVKCYWTGLTSIVYDDFTYPDIALIGIKALATDQISGTPSLTFLKERTYVWVYNPNTSAYEQKPANNPAWACYDMVHECSRLMNIHTGAYEFEVRGAAKELMMYDKFAEWADFCTSKQLYVNIEINTVGELMDVVNKQLAPIGRGFVLWFGTKCGCIWDSAKDPVQMFGMGNIISGTFKESFLSTADRANCVELTFTNADADYTRDTLTVFSDDFDSDNTEKVTQITYDGITSYKQAFREAKYLLYCNKYLIRTVSFEANVDAIACTIGDCILVAHDVPKWAYSGRIYSVDGTTLVLPVEVADVTKTYKINFRSINDVIYTKAVTSISTKDGYTTVVIADVNADDPPQVNDVFDLAIIEKGAKPFTVKSITRSQDFTRKIECIEYNENIYNENYDIPVINYTMEDNAPQNVINLKGNIIGYSDSNGNKHALLEASWELPTNAPTCKYTILISTDGQNYKVMESNSTQQSCSFEVDTNTSYFLKVISILGLQQTSGTVSSLIPAAVDVLPPDVTALDHELLADGTRRYWWTFDYPTPNDIKGFRIKYIQGTTVNWNLGTPVNEGIVTTQPYETRTVRHGTHTIMIKAVDNADQESENFAYCVVNLGDLLEENVLATVDFSKNNWSGVSTTGTIRSDGTIVSNQTTAFWLSNTADHWSLQKTPYWQESKYAYFETEMSFIAEASGQFWLEYSITGPAVVYYRRLSGANAYWKADEATFYSTEADYAWKANSEMWKQYSDKIMIKSGDHIDIKVVAANNITQKTVIKSLSAVIDVPDRTEHFENLLIPLGGKQLNIVTPNYYTTGVHIDAVQEGASSILLLPVIVSRNPCVIKIMDTDGNPATATIDVTWQGFEKEILA